METMHAFLIEILTRLPWLNLAVGILLSIHTSTSLQTSPKVKIRYLPVTKAFTGPLVFLGYLCRIETSPLKNQI